MLPFEATSKDKQDCEQELIDRLLAQGKWREAETLRENEHAKSFKDEYAPKIEAVRIRSVADRELSMGNLQKVLEMCKQYEWEDLEFAMVYREKAEKVRIKGVKENVAKFLA